MASPVTDTRANPKDLEGTFWVIKRDEGEHIDYGRGPVPIFINMTFWIAHVSQNPDGNYSLQLQGSYGEPLISEDKPVSFRVLYTADPDIFLALENAPEGEERNFDPKLLVRSQSGTWVFYNWYGDIETPIPGAETSYLQGIAKKHGVDISATYNWWRLEFDETVGDPALSALFSDPAFLGGLRLGTKFSGRLFPVGKAPGIQKPEWPEEDEDGEHEGGNIFLTDVLHSPKFPISADELAEPSGFAGHYTNIEITRKKDGSYQLNYPGGRVRNESLGLLSLAQGGEQEADETGGTYLGLSEYFDVLQGKTVYTWYLVNIGCDGDVVLTSISRTGFDDTNPIFSKKLEALTRRLMAQAAQRHGLTIFDNHVAGDLSASNVRALFADPQFQVGLKDYGRGTRYKASNAVNRCKSWAE